MRARLLIAMSVGAATCARTVCAGPWNIEPSLGASTDYESNPGLHSSSAQAEEHVAALIDVPLRYDANAFEFTLRPNGRLSNSSGYASLASNYVHIDTSAQFVDELSTTTWQGELARDSSLYFVGGLVNGVGVRRDTASTGIDWTRTLTYRHQIELNASWSEVRYDQNANETNLVNYRYLSGGPTWAFLASERNTIKLLGTVGHYESLNGVTDSKSYNLQLGFVRQLSELWTLSTTAGYARSINSEKYYFGPFYLGTLKSNENGTVYSAVLTRKGERFNLTASGSRALQPTGLAYLSRLDSANVTATYTQSVRWDYGAGVTWQRVLNPVIQGAQVNVRYTNAQLTANWHWSERWILSMSVGRIGEQYIGSASSNGGTLSVMRRFLRTEF